MRLGVLIAIGGAVLAGASFWPGAAPDQAAIGSLARLQTRSHPAAPALAAAPTPLLRPGFVAGYVARPLGQSTPLSASFQPARPAPKLAVLDPETTGSIGPSAPSAASPLAGSPVARLLPTPPAAAEPEQKIVLTGPLPIPRPADLKLPAAAEPRAATRAGSRRSKDVAAAVEPADNRSFLEKIFGVRAPSTGTQLAYAAPREDLIDRSRGSGLTVAPTPAPSPLASPMSVGPKTAVYDISARVVHLPNGERLEANSGLGDKMNDLRFVHVRMHGPTPPHVYDLTEREALFHGVRAIRMHPVGGAGKIFGRTGLLVHSYLLGPRGDSNGCVSVKDYDRFLQAFLRGEIKRLIVVGGRG